MRYEVKPGKPSLFFIRDTVNDRLVRGRNNALLSYRKRKDAERTADRMNGDAEQHSRSYEHGEDAEQLTSSANTISKA